VIIPTFSERESNARRIAEVGAGEYILPTEGSAGEKHVNIDNLRMKVRKVLSDPSYAKSAHRVSEKLRAYGGALEAANQIENFIFPIKKTEDNTSSKNARDYFEFNANLGMTEHYGSMEATRELVELCRIGNGKYVLDVGCGVGATPCYLAKAVDCRVVGVDLVEKMIEQSKERAKAEGVEDRVEFRVADARKLPFEDNLFDTVIMESVNIFFEDKRQAMSEYIRVTKPGGYVGMTEMTWLKPPSPELEDTFKSMVYAQALDVSGWKDLMEEAGLMDVVGNLHRIKLPFEGKGRFERYGGWGVMKIMLKMLVMVLSDRRSRRFMKDGVGAMSKDLLGVIGYGVYVGRKE
jgi:ubiquinone/menaquinone biosynthesis C-methylase UbiE